MTTFDDLAALVGVAQEGQRLELKRAGALTGGGMASELVKDVSAMANAEGGRIIYGVADPIVDAAVTRARLTQLVANNTSPTLRAFAIEQVIGPTGRFMVVDVEQGATAHQSTLDRKYYQRVGVVVEAMLDFQIRDVMARRTAPIVEFDLGRVVQARESDRHVYRLAPRVLNVGGVTLERGFWRSTFLWRLDLPSSQLPCASMAGLRTQFAADHRDCSL